MAQNDDDGFQRLRWLAEFLEHREIIAEAQQGRIILSIAGILFILGSIVVLLMTGRVILVIMTYLICIVGAAIAFIGSRPSSSNF
jgi:hypothetical protein